MSPPKPTLTAAAAAAGGTGGGGAAAGGGTCAGGVEPRAGQEAEAYVGHAMYERWVLRDMTSN